MPKLDKEKATIVRDYFNSNSEISLGITHKINSRYIYKSTRFLEKMKETRCVVP